MAGAARDIEDRAVAEAAALCEGLERERLSQDRRALRVNVRGIEGNVEPQGRVSLAFALPPGAYATTVLGEIFSLDRFRESAGGPAPSGE